MRAIDHQSSLHKSKTLSFSFRWDSDSPAVPAVLSATPPRFPAPLSKPAGSLAWAPSSPRYQPQQHCGRSSCVAFSLPFCFLLSLSSFSSSSVWVASSCSFSYFRQNNWISKRHQNRRAALYGMTRILILAQWQKNGEVKFAKAALKSIFQCF